MKKLVLLIVWAIFVAILSGLGYYYYRMNFANILIKIKPSETYSYSVNLIEVIDMDIQHDGSLSKQEEDTLKQEFKYFVQKELKGAINDISDFSVLIECKLKFIPKVLEQNYIKEAKVMTERCYEKVAGRIQDYSNREYEVSDKKADIFKPLIDIPYCLDFCDGKKIKKGQTIEGMVYSKYINERLKEVFDDGAIATKLVPGKLEYKVEDIDWNTVKLKLSGSYGPIQVEDKSLKGIGILEGTISGNIWYDRRKRIFTHSELNIPMVVTFELFEDTYEYKIKGKVIMKLSLNIKETMDLSK